MIVTRYTCMEDKKRSVLQGRAEPRTQRVRFGRQRGPGLRSLRQLLACLRVSLPVNGGEVAVRLSDARGVSLWGVRANPAERKQRIRPLRLILRESHGGSWPPLLGHHGRRGRATRGGGLLGGSRCRHCRLGVLTEQRRVRREATHHGTKRRGAARAHVPNLGEEAALHGYGGDVGASELLQRILVLVLRGLPTEPVPVPGWGRGHLVRGARVGGDCGWRTPAPHLGLHLRQRLLLLVCGADILRRSERRRRVPRVQETHLLLHEERFHDRKSLRVLGLELAQLLVLGLTRVSAHEGFGLLRRFFTSLFGRPL